MKTEVLSKMIFFGEGSLRHCLEHYLCHYHAERNHQGKEHVILFPAPADRIGEPTGEILTRERLGGLLKFYHRKAARYAMTRCRAGGTLSPLVHEEFKP